MGFFLTVIYVMIIFIRPQDFVPALLNAPILDYIAVFTMVFVFLEGKFSSHALKLSAANAMIIGLWFAVTASWLANFWIGGATDAFKEFSGVVIVYFLIVMTVDSIGKMRFLLWAMIICTAMLAVQALMLKLTGYSFMAGETFEREGVIQVRGVGIFADPNDLAMALVCFIPFLLPAFHVGLLAPTRIIGLLVLVLDITGVVITRSRGGVVGMAFVAWYYFKRRVGTVMTVAIMIVLLYAMMAIPRMGTIDTQEQSAQGRLLLWGTGLDIWRNYMIFGAGMHSFVDHAYKTAHNSYILILAETGLVGTFFWLSLFYCAFREIHRMRRLARPPPYLEKLLNALSGSLIGWMTCGFFLSQSYKHLLFIIIAVVVATLNVVVTEGYEFESRWTGRNLFHCILITLVSVPAMWLFLRLMWVM